MKYVVVLLVGIAFGYFLRPTPQIESKLTPEVSNKFQNLIDNEAKNFALQKDAAAKLKAAEELYGKMMLLFLANLNLKSSHEFVAAEKAAVNQLNENQTKIEITRDSTSPNTVKVSSTSAPASQKEINQNKIQERYDKYRSAHYLESFKRKERRLLGHFVGTLDHMRPANRTDNVRMEFNLIQDGKSLSGHTLVTISDSAGNEYSKNAGNGGNRALKIHSREEDSYYVDASPTSFFILRFAKFPRIDGQYFEKGKLIGNVYLKKVLGDM